MDFHEIWPKMCHKWHKMREICPFGAQILSFLARRAEFLAISWEIEPKPRNASPFGARFLVILNLLVLKLQLLLQHMHLWDASSMWHHALHHA